ncbi:MAG: type IX secretion system sortase PorU [Parabacteroides sp.]
MLLQGGELFAIPATDYAASSVLATGKWVKIQVTESGIYKLSNTDLQKMGFSDPSRVSVHGYGGWPLAEDFSKPYIDDLPATAVWRTGDGLLFYARGPIQWSYNASTGTFEHTNNPYSTAGYYFVTDATEVKEMESLASVEGATLTVRQFDDYQLHEKELVSLNESGRQLFGESFAGNLSQSFTFSMPGITNDDGKVTLRFVSKATSGSGNVSLTIGDQRVVSGTIRSSSKSDTYTKAIAFSGIGTWTGDKTESIRTTVQYSTTGHENVRLDYIRLQAQRTLKPYGAYTFFRNISSIGNVSRFVIQEATERTVVFDVTDPVNPQVMETTRNGSELSFTIPAGSLREFAVVQTDRTFASPVTVGDVEPQDLHALPQNDMIIIAPKAFAVQAETLAQAHRDRDNLRVQVVQPEKIYNEFSSGTPDATAYRRFLKMFYDRSSSEEDAPKYLLLFGDGVYDNRGLYLTTLNRDNLLLTYQSQESLNINSYVTDDYFGMLDDTDGANLACDGMDIGVGRFPVRTTTEAANVVTKLITYMSNQQTGAWKNKVAFVADDGSASDSYATYHLTQSNTEADYIENNYPEFLVNKIFFDAYKKEKDASGTTTYPAVRSKIQQLLKEGILMINYTGHGNTQAWSDEKVLTQTDILQSQYTCLPLWITATCDFTRFDDLNTSAGEDVLLHKSSGGVALYTTTRAVYPDENFKINQELIKHLFEKNEGHRLTFGEVMKQTKNKLGCNSNKLNFILIGDPAMKLAYPEYQMQVTRINGEAVGSEPFTFKAMQRVTIEGEVHNAEGSLAGDFNGMLYPTVLDAKNTAQTLDNNAVGDTISYTLYNNTLYIGNDSVRNGRFSFSFTVPKDISYSNNYGKLNLYAADELTNQEAQGAFLNFRVGETDETAEKDTIGPEIRALFLNDTTFVEGGQVNPTPLFAAKLWDKSGVNVSGSSIGHDIMLTIDNQTSRSYNLNSYFQILTGSDGEGLVQFSIPALEEGLHTAEFKVWDVQNNSTTLTFTFEVVKGLKPQLMDLYATPNPARGQVEFHLEHNRPETTMQVRIFVYDMTGRRVWWTEESGSSELFKSYIVTWDLTNQGGSRLRPGVYLYRASIRTPYSKEVTKANKLIILAQ